MIGILLKLLTIPLIDSASVVVHVVSGERPAAMQSGATISAPTLLYTLFTIITLYSNRHFVAKLIIYTLYTPFSLFLTPSQNKALAPRWYNKAYNAYLDKKRITTIYFRWSI